MKLSLFLTTSLAAVLIVMLSACTTNSSQTQRTVAQKQPVYQPSYYTQNSSANYNPNANRGQMQSEPLPPILPSATAPQTAAPTNAGTGSMTGSVIVPPQQSPAAPQAPNGKIKVAILLPLSGRNANLGQSMLNAAQQAVFDSAATNFELQPRDTAGEGGAEAAARAAIHDGAQLIIGPLFSGDIPVVKTIAQGANVQMLPLSTDTSQAEHGVYVMGLAPSGQVDRIVSFAAARGARHFAALVPENQYGELVGREFQIAVAQAGGSVVDFETYDPAAKDSEERVHALSLRRDEIDALFLPESGGDLKIIADQLAAAGISPVRTHLIGTGLWDVPNLGAQSTILNGAWYAAPDPALRRNFTAAYAQAYGQEPPRLSTLAYDATALAAVLAKRGGRFDDAALTNPNGFAGLDGIFRLQPSGIVERALAINMATTGGQAQIIDPAPTSFVGRK